MDNYYILSSEFEEIVSKIRNNFFDQFHIYVEIKFINHDSYVSDWCIYRKFKPFHEYLLSNEPAILSSTAGNTIEDLKKFVNAL